MLAVRCWEFFLSRVEIISNWKRENKGNIYFHLNWFFLKKPNSLILICWKSKAASEERLDAEGTWGLQCLSIYICYVCIQLPSGKADNTMWDTYTLHTDRGRGHAFKRELEKFGQCVEVSTGCHLCSAGGNTRVAVTIILFFTWSRTFYIFGKGYLC